MIDRLATARCPTRGCRIRRRNYQFCCSRCWHALPPELRNAFEAELSNCRKSGIPHSQELHAKRDECIRYLNDKSDERRAAKAARFSSERY